MNDQYTPLLVYGNAIGLPPLASRPVRTALLSPVGPEGYSTLGQVVLCQHTGCPCAALLAVVWSDLLQLTSAHTLCATLSSCRGGAPGCNEGHTVGPWPGRGSAGPFWMCFYVMR
jgi:hypothetical protein